MTQLDFHNMTSQVTQEQIDLQNQLEMHTADLITKPLSNYSPVLFLDTKETSDDPIPDQMEHQMTVIKHLVSTPLDDKDTSHYTALSKQSYSYNELLFIAAKVISYMVQAEQQLAVQNEQRSYNDHKSPSKSPIKQTTSEKLATILNNRTLKDLTQMLDPYKRNSSDSPITTHNHLIHCHNRTSQLLQTLDLDSQRKTQSSQAIQSALESMNTLFNTLNIQ